MVVDESFVRRSVAEHFRSKGYKVSFEVKTHKGYIDLVAEKEGEKWIIECKGEALDPLINLYMVLGQIALRMSVDEDSETKYIIAITEKC